MMVRSFPKFHSHSEKQLAANCEMLAKWWIDRRLTALAVLAVCIGCSKGPELGEVTGKLTYNGQPVQYAAVEFHPITEGKHSIGYTDAQGEYTVQYTIQRAGALVGRHRIVIKMYPPEGVTSPPVPPKYKGGAEGEVEVTAGGNRFDIELAS
jgi:hypothetical protein